MIKYQRDHHKKGGVPMHLPIDPMMLYSVVNTKLRDYYPSLEKLCEDMNISQKDLEQKLQSVGFIYDQELNKFL